MRGPSTSGQQGGLPVDGGAVRVPNHEGLAVNDSAVSVVGDFGHDKLSVSGASRSSVSEQDVGSRYVVSVLIYPFIPIAYSAVDHAGCFNDGFNSGYVVDPASSCFLHWIGDLSEVGIHDVFVVMGVTHYVNCG